MLSLVIGNKNYSSWSLRPWLLLRHFEIPFEEIRIPLFQTSTHRRIARYSAAGKVPILLHRNLTVWDSLAICDYISENLLRGAGWPASAPARGTARSVAAEMHSGFPDLRNELPMNCRWTMPLESFSAGVMKDTGRIESLWEGCRTRFGAGGPWLFGDFSIADCMYAPVAIRFRSYGVSLGATATKYQKTVLNHPAVLDWCQDGVKEIEVIEEAEFDNK